MPSARPSRILLASLAVTALGAPTGASAAVSRTTIAGPSADLAGTSDIRVDSAPDGTTALAFRKLVGGQQHVFVSVLEGSTWSTPEQVDDGLPGAPKASLQPALAVANGGRVVVVFPNGTTGFEALYTAIKVGAATPFSPVQTVQGAAAGWKDPQIDLAPNGSGFVTVQEAKHVRAFRLQGANFQPVGPGYPNSNVPAAGGGVLNKDEPEPGDMRGAKVAVNANGTTATVIWTESPAGGDYHLFARRLTGLAVAEIGPAVESDVTTFQGHAGTTSFNDMGTVATGGGTTWIGYRAAFTYNNPPQQIPRALVRTFDGTSLGPPQTIDGIPAETTQGAEYPRIALNEAGQGISAAYRQLTPFGTEASSLVAGTWSPATFTVPGPSTAAGRASVAIDSNGAGLVAFHASPTPTTAQVLARIRGGAQDGALETLSEPAFGLAEAPNTAGAGNGRAVTAFVQGAGATTRIVAAVVDLPPTPTAATPAPTPTPPTNGQQPTLLPSPAPAVALSGVRFRDGKTTATIRRGTLLPRVVAANASSRTFQFTVDRASTITLSMQRVVTGKRGKAGCGPGKAKGKSARCTYRRPVPGTATLQGLSGVNHVQFAGRLTTARALALGRYDLVAIAAAPGAAPSAPATLALDLKAPPKKR